MALNTAPWPPDNFIDRPAEFDQLLKLLLDPGEPRTVAVTTALQGGGGFGKTTLAQAICHDPRINQAFSAILWLTIGQTPPLLELLNSQIRLLDDKAAALTDLNVAAARLRELLAGRRVLLVLDDVWHRDDLTPFLQPGLTACAHRSPLATRIWPG